MGGLKIRRPRADAASVMRRLSLLPLVLAALLLVVPTGARAATPGVNIAGIPSVGDLSQAQATGAKYVRVFVLGSQMLDHATFAGVAATANGLGMKVVFVLPGNADGSNTPPAAPAGSFAYAPVGPLM